MDDDAVFALAADLEGHPDNVAPALYGGFTVAYRDGDRFRATTLAVDPRVQVVAFVPPDGVETSVARGLLPATVAARATPPPTPDGRRCSSRRSAASPSCCSPRPRTGSTRATGRRPCPPPSTWSARCAPTGCRRSSPVPVRPCWCFTDASQQQAVAGRCPEGWTALTVPIDRDGARVGLPE